MIYNNTFENNLNFIQDQDNYIIPSIYNEKKSEYEEVEQIYKKLIDNIQENKNLFNVQTPIGFELDDDTLFKFDRNSLNIPILSATSKTNSNPTLKINASSSVDKFIINNYDTAKKLGKKYGYSPEFILAVMRIETGNGKSSAYLNHNIGFNIQSTNGSGYTQRDKDMSGNTYTAKYKTYNTIEDSIEDFLKWCKRHNVTGNSDEEIARSFAYSGFAEGVGDSYEDAKNKLYNNYITTINDTKKYISKLGLN